MCLACNVSSLIAILTAHETLGIDMNRVDSAVRLAGDDRFTAAVVADELDLDCTN